MENVKEKSKDVDNRSKNSAMSINRVERRG